MKRFRVSTGSIIGKDHTLRQANCQDKVALTEITVGGDYYLIGVVCDGCGSGRHSEVGAGLLSAFLVQEATRQLTKGVSLEWLPDLLYKASLRYLRRVLYGLRPVDSPRMEQMLADYLLTTVLGFVMNSQKGIIFTAGDGLCVVNKHVIPLDQQNQPRYLAYDLLREADVAAGFEVREFKVSALERLAIWTDGLDPVLLPETWGHDQPRSLQRRLNLLSKKGRLHDDTTGIVVEMVA
jgi:hypothetical protein